MLDDETLKQMHKDLRKWIISKFEHARVPGQDGKQGGHNAHDMMAILALLQSEMVYWQRIITASNQELAPDLVKMLLGGAEHGAASAEESMAKHGEPVAQWRNLKDIAKN